MILGLDGDVDEIEGNYMLVTEAATNEGLLQKSLEEVSPTSAYTVEEAGARPYPDREAKKRKDAASESTRMNFNDEWREVDPELDSLLVTGGYAKKHDEEMMEAENGYDEELIMQYGHFSRGPVSGGISPRHSVLLVVVSYLAFMIQ